MACDRKIGPFPCCSVVQGDCLELMKQLPDGCVDAVITDPPYNSGLKYATYIDSRDDYWPWMVVLTKEMCRISAVVLVKHSALKIVDWARHIGGRQLVWYKPFSSGFPLNGVATHFEPIWWLKGRSAQWSKDVVEICAGNSHAEATTGHPAQMPESLATWELETFTGDDAVVIDPFAGSGTTLVAAKKLGRHFLGFEISEAYCQIARERLARIDAQPSLFEKKPEQLSL